MKWVFIGIAVLALAIFGLFAIGARGQSGQAMPLAGLAGWFLGGGLLALDLISAALWYGYRALFGVLAVAVLGTLLLAPVQAYAATGGVDFTPLVQQVINAVAAILSILAVPLVTILILWAKRKFHLAGVNLSAAQEGAIDQLVQSSVDNATALGVGSANAYLATHPVKVDTGSAIGNFAAGIAADHASPIIAKVLDPQKVATKVEAAVARAAGVAPLPLVPKRPS